MILEQRGAIMQAAVALAAANHVHPTQADVMVFYNILVNLLDPPDPPRPRADPSQYTANSTGG